MSLLPGSEDKPEAIKKKWGIAFKTHYVLQSEVSQKNKYPTLTHIYGI